jgi:nucleoside 2-deoxyribosyltransferase
MVFYPNPDDIFSAMKATCARRGLIGLSPLDRQTELAAVKPGHDLAVRIVRADIALMREVDAGVFCLDGFRRSPEMDPGTAFEIGYMHALGKPLAGWTRDPRDYLTRVRDYFRERHDPPPTLEPQAGTGARSGVSRDVDGILVHSEGCYQNAMTQIGIELSGGQVFADTDWEKAFESAVIALADILLGASRQGKRAIA